MDLKGSAPSLTVQVQDWGPPSPLEWPTPIEARVSVPFVVLGAYTNQTIRSTAFTLCIDMFIKVMGTNVWVPLLVAGGRGGGGERENAHTHDTVNGSGSGSGSGSEVC